jgi:DNA-binding NtrC family response regulator
MDKKESDKKESFAMLIVDDEQDVRKSLQRLFARTAYHLLFAVNGEEALDSLLQHSVDLMLLDLKMPGMDGISVLQEALAKWPEIKVIILTGHGGVRETVSSIKLGAIDFFEKSAPPEMLCHKIDQLNKLWRLEKENKGLREQLSMKFTFVDLIGESFKGCPAQLFFSAASSCER